MLLKSDLLSYWGFRLIRFFSVIWVYYFLIKIYHKVQKARLRAIFIDVPGLSEYEKIWDLQKRIHSLRVKKVIYDVLIFTEHGHVYTVGKAGDESDLKIGENFLKHLGIKFFKIDRGGKITYHGPGQIVGYPVFHLEELGIDVHSYLRMIEEVIILTLSDFGIKSERRSNLTGVWVGEDKIASIGIKVSHWVTMHGFALNVNTDLKYFDFIFPCGLRDVKMTSMQRILGREVDMGEVKKVLREKFENVFGFEFIETDLEIFEKKREIF